MFPFPLLSIHEMAAKEVSKAIFDRMMEREDEEQLVWIMSDDANCCDVEPDEISHIERIMMRADWVSALFYAVDECCSPLDKHQMIGDTYMHRITKMKDMILKRLKEKE